MLHVNKRSTCVPNLVVPRSLGATRVAGGGKTNRLQGLGLDLVKAPAPLTDRVKATEEPESLKLAPFGGSGNKDAPFRLAGNQPSLSEVIKFFKEGTDSTAPPSSLPGTGPGLTIQSCARNDEKEDLPPIATILDTAGPIRTQPLHRATPAVPYKRTVTKDAKVDSGGDLLYFLANVATASTDSDEERTEVDFTFDDNEEVDQLDSDSESEADSAVTSTVTFRSVREKKTIDLSNDDDVEMLPPPPGRPSPPYVIKAIPSDATSRFTPSFPWEFFACDIALGLSLYDAECSRLRSTGEYTQARAKLLIAQVFDGAKVTLATFKRRRAEIETKEGRKLLWKFAKMGRKPEACFLNLLRAVRQDPWFKPSRLSCLKRTLRNPSANA